ncbi:MAG TPA: hypothetical protein VK934_06160 [Fimbriimonas sp.]|nr:hypothetical protein [Fimbriimonas sp.]
MITTLLAFAPALAPFKPSVAKIVTASMFKNGFAVVTREIDAPRAGEYSIASIPQGSLGTLWFTVTEGMRLESVVNTTVEETVKQDLGTIDSLLAANSGKKVKLGIREPDKVTGEVVVGTLVSSSGELAIVKTDTKTLAFRKAHITSIAVANGEGVLKYTTTGKQAQRALRFTVTGRPGKIVMISLERGLTWAPGYAVDITHKEKLSMVAKATLINDLGALDNIEARFITGFPNVPFAQYIDPLVSGQNAQGFINMIGQIGGPGGRGGGFGGGRAGDLMSQNAAGPAPAMDFGEAMATSPLSGEQREDLFFYRQPGVKMKQGDRAYYVLFRMESPYQTLYTWDMDDQLPDNVDYRPVPAGPGDVWHTLQFKNTSGQPLTTGAATAFKSGEIVGQDLMKYVPINGTAELKINKSLDIRAELDESEVTRERGAIKNQGGYPVFDLVTLKTTLQVTNLKPETVKMRIKRTFTGELVSAEGDPQVVKTARGLTQMNPVTKLEWSPAVESGKMLKLTYTYKMYVRSQG